ncbi:MAG: hypothetical protein Q9159_004512, partial [Coniocarpon cinnabarinum]
HIKTQASQLARDPDSHNGVTRLLFNDRQRRGHKRVHSSGPRKGMLIDEESGLRSPRPGLQNHEYGPEHTIQSEPVVPTLHGLGHQTSIDAHAPIRSATAPQYGEPTQGDSSPKDEQGQHSTGASDSTAVGSGSSSKNSGETGSTLRQRPSHKNTDETTVDPEKGLPDEGNELSKTKSERKRARFREPIPIKHQLRCVFVSWPNILLICVPVGIAIANVDGISPLAVFLVNFLAIVPLAGTLSYATEEIAMRVGETLGGLLNASFGNATELIVAIIALVKGQITIVQTSLVGSILSNLLLVLGMCFALGGYNRPEQHFNMTVAQTACSLLILAGASLIIPTAFQKFSDAPDAETRVNEPKLSRGTAIILLFVYACYLFFQLRTHVNVYNAPSEKVTKQNLVRRNTAGPNANEGNSNVTKGISTMGAPSAAGAGGQLNAENVSQKDHATQEDREEDEEDEEVPNLSTVGAIATLCGSTALIGVCSEYVVDNISEVASQNNVPLEFIGLILLPIVGNAAEHATAVTVAIKDKMDLSIGVAVGSSLQIALLVIPLSVVIGWIVGAKNPAPPQVAEGPMTLNFDGFIVTILFVSILLVNYLIQDGKSHWLEGVMLMTTYIIIAVAAWFYPDPAGLAGE